MDPRQEVRQGTLTLMVLRTLCVLGLRHGYGISRRIEQTSGELLAVNNGTLDPILLELEQEGSIVSEWGVSDSSRKPRYCRITRTGRRQLASEHLHWEQTAGVIARFFAIDGERS
jgi:PadR family transcriptional regulator PadR